MNKNNKKFDGFEEQGCHRGHWDRGGHHRHWRLRMAQDLVADVAESEIEITAEAAVGKGAMFQTLTPLTKMDRNLGAAVRTASRQAPTGECGAIHLAPTDKTID